MKKSNKEFEARMQGMLYAHKIAKERGLDELEKEIKLRGILKLDIWADKKEVDALYDTLSTNLYQHMLVTIMYSIHREFGFGRDRLMRLKKEFDKNVKMLLKLDWMGEHYTTFEDWGIELNQKFGLDFNVERMAALRDAQDEKSDTYQKLDRASVLAKLEEAGYQDAAKFLKEKM